MKAMRSIPPPIGVGDGVDVELGEGVGVIVGVTVDVSEGVVVGVDVLVGVLVTTALMVAICEFWVAFIFWGELQEANRIISSIETR
jgi:hypothetical protein